MLDDLLGEFILKPVFGFVFYWTGKPIIRILSLGRIRVSFTAEPPKAKGKRSGHSLVFRHNGSWHTSAEMAMLVGGAVWVLGILIVVLVWTTQTPSIPPTTAG